MSFGPIRQYIFEIGADEILELQTRRFFSR